MKNRKIKEEIVQRLTKKLKSQNVCFLDFAGIPSQEMAILRTQAKERKIKLKVAKRNLLIRALKKAQIKAEIPQGNYLLASSEDEVLPFKFLYEFIKEKEKGAFQGGIFEKKWIDAVKVEQIAQLPSKEELMVKLLCTLKAPINQLHYILSYNLRGLINILHQKTKIQQA